LEKAYEKLFRHRWWATAPRFAYSVGEREYESGRPSFSGHFPVAFERKQDFDSLPQDIAVRVYYNPADPADAVLTPGAAPGLYINCAIAWLSLLALVAFAVLWRAT